MGSFTRWMYRGQRPNRVAKFMNRFSAVFGALGLTPTYLVTLEVIGRKSGKAISFPLVMTVIDGERYLVSMLGNDVQWVRNVEANGGRATLLIGRREDIQLVEIPVEQRAPILKAYIRRAPGARPHIPVNKDAPLSDFKKIADKYPVFRVIAQKS